MKINQWTLGLAAAGVVSFAVGAQAEEAKEAVKTHLSSTVLSGYVNTSIHYNPNQTAAPGYAIGAGKANGFNLDVVNVTIEKPLSEEAWAAGYKAELLYGPDAKQLGTGSRNLAFAANPNNLSDFGIKQAYVNLRIPVGNGLETKLGVFDALIGTETFNAGSNPNYTRAWSYTIEPFQHTGLQASYRFCEWMSLSAALANTTTSVINGRPGTFSFAGPGGNQGNLSHTALVSLTAPKSAGSLAGATLNFGYLGGRSDGSTGFNSTGPSSYNIYAGASIPLPVTGLSLGLAYDKRILPNVAAAGGKNNDDDVYGLYLSYRATKKLTLNLRGEYADLNSGFASTPGGIGNGTEILAGTFTADYALWANVVTRLEYRIDHDLTGNAGKPGYTTIIPQARNNAHLLALNVIYKF